MKFPLILLVVLFVFVSKAQELVPCVDHIQCDEFVQTLATQSGGSFVPPSLYCNANDQHFAYCLPTCSVATNGLQSECDTFKPLFALENAASECLNQHCKYDYSCTSARDCGSKFGNALSVCNSALFCEAPASTTTSAPVTPTCDIDTLDSDCDLSLVDMNCDPARDTTNMVPAGACHEFPNECAAKCFLRGTLSALGFTAETYVETFYSMLCVAEAHCPTTPDPTTTATTDATTTTVQTSGGSTDTTTTAVTTSLCPVCTGADATNAPLPEKVNCDPQRNSMVAGYVDKPCEVFDSECVARFELCLTVSSLDTATQDTISYIGGVDSIYTMICEAGAHCPTTTAPTTTTTTVQTSGGSTDTTTTAVITSSSSDPNPTSTSAGNTQSTDSTHSTDSTQSTDSTHNTDNTQATTASSDCRSSCATDEVVPAFCQIPSEYANLLPFDCLEADNLCLTKCAVDDQIVAQGHTTAAVDQFLGTTDYGSLDGLKEQVCEIGTCPDSGTGSDPATTAEDTTGGGSDPATTAEDTTGGSDPDGADPTTTEAATTVDLGGSCNHGYALTSDCVDTERRGCSLQLDVSLDFCAIDLRFPRAYVHNSMKLALKAWVDENVEGYQSWCVNIDEIDVETYTLELTDDSRVYGARLPSAEQCSDLARVCDGTNATDTDPDLDVQIDFSLGFFCGAAATRCSDVETVYAKALAILSSDRSGFADWIGERIRVIGTDGDDVCLGTDGHGLGFGQVVVSVNSASLSRRDADGDIVSVVNIINHAPDLYHGVAVCVSLLMAFFF